MILFGPFILKTASSLDPHSGRIRCHWMVIVVNLAKQTWFFCMMLPVGVVLCMSGQYWVFSPLAGIIAVRCRGMLATRRCRPSTEYSAHFFSRTWRSSPIFRGRLSILVIAWPNSSQICSMGLLSGNLAGCIILETWPCWRKSKIFLGTARCGVIVSVAVVILKMLPSKWH